jgi:hypothetical protein
MSASSAAGLIGIASTLPTLSIIVVSLRFCARHQQDAKIKLDDIATLPALVSSTSLYVLQQAAQLLTQVLNLAIASWYGRFGNI